MTMNFLVSKFCLKAMNMALFWIFTGCLLSITSCDQESSTGMASSEHLSETVKDAITAQEREIIYRHNNTVFACLGQSYMVRVVEIKNADLLLQVESNITEADRMNGYDEVYFCHYIRQEGGKEMAYRDYDVVTKEWSSWKAGSPVPDITDLFSFHIGFKGNEPAFQWSSSRMEQKVFPVLLKKEHIDIIEKSIEKK